jgi:AraC-like DNA-binding protein
MEFLGTSLFIKQDITNLLSYVGAIQGFILAVVVLFYPSQHKTSNRILSIFLFTLSSLLIAPRLMEATGSFNFAVVYAYRLLVPVMLYLYIESLYQQLQWRKRMVHVIPVLVDALLVFGVIAFRNAASPEFVIEENSIYKIIRLASYNWPAIVCVFYIFLIRNSIKRFRFKVAQNFSSQNNLGLVWVHQIFVGYLILFTVDVIFTLISVTWPEAYKPYFGLANTITYTAFMYFMTIKGKLSPEIYKLKTLKVEPDPDGNDKDAGLLSNTEENDEELLMLSERVVQCIEKDKMYLEMGLTVHEVAEKLNTQPYLVSQAINNCLGKNFFELVNRYRVDEAKQLLLNDAYNHLSMMGIGYEAGFNSKTAFNTAFKKYTGLTPSEYKRNKDLAKHLRISKN